jgi:hypothetical protein
MTRRKLGGTTTWFGLTAGATLSLFVACSDSPEAPDDAGTAPDATVAPREDADEIPCEPRRVLQTVCQRCHARPAQNGAPFALVTRSDVLASYAGSVIRELMIQEVEAGRMPLPPVTISPADREILLGWLRAGAPAVPARSCDDAGGSARDDGGPDGGETRDADGVDAGGRDADASPVDAARDRQVDATDAADALPPPVDD